MRAVRRDSLHGPVRVDRLRGGGEGPESVAGEQRELMAAHVQRVIDLPGDPGPKMRELASFASAELGLSGVAVERRMTEAWTIVTELPAAHEAAAAIRARWAMPPENWCG